MVIGSNNASGPSSDIGGAEAGCDNEILNQNHKNNCQGKHGKHNLDEWYHDTFLSKRTLANRLLSVNDSSNPSSNCIKIKDY